MSKLNETRGFTLIELLVALTIFAVGLLALATMQITAIQGNYKANRLSQEAAMAQGIMEQILSWNRDDARLKTTIANVTWTFHDGTTVLAMPNPDDPTKPMTRLTAVYSVTAGAPIADMATIQVTVTGPGVGLGNRVTLTEYKKTVD